MHVTIMLAGNLLRLIGKQVQILRGRATVTGTGCRLATLQNLQGKETSGGERKPGNLPAGNVLGLREIKGGCVQNGYW